jgi:hypothetical protein
VDVFLGAVLPSVKNVQDICQYLRRSDGQEPGVLGDEGWCWFQGDAKDGKLKGTEGDIYNKPMENLAAAVFGAVEALGQSDTSKEKANGPALNMKFVCDGEKTFVGERLSSHKPDAGLTLVGEHKKSLEAPALAPDSKPEERLHVEDVFLVGEYKRHVRGYVCIGSATLIIISSCKASRGDHRACTSTSMMSTHRCPPIRITFNSSTMPLPF